MTFCIPSVISLKDLDMIIKAIFSCWIKIYGPAEKLLTDKGEELANSNSLISESMNIRVVTIAA